MCQIRGTGVLFFSKGLFICWTKQKGWYLLRTHGVDFYCQDCISAYSMEDTQCMNQQTHQDKSSSFWRSNTNSTSLQTKSKAPWAWHLNCNLTLVRLCNDYIFNLLSYFSAWHMNTEQPISPIIQSMFFLGHWRGRRHRWIIYSEHIDPRHLQLNAARPDAQLLQHLYTPNQKHLEPDLCSVI